MKRRLYTLAVIDHLATEEGQTALVLARSDILTPAAWDRARELGLTVVYGDDPASDLPAWSGAAQRVRSGRWLPEHAPGAGDQAPSGRPRARCPNPLACPTLDLER